MAGKELWQLAKGLGIRWWVAYVVCLLLWSWVGLMLRNS